MSDPGEAELIHDWNVTDRLGGEHLAPGRRLLDALVGAAPGRP